MSDKLKNMSERELLLLIDHRLENIEAVVGKVSELEKRIFEMETKIKVWSSVAALVGTVAGIILPKILHL